MLRITFINKIYNYLIIKYRGVEYEKYPLINGRVFICCKKKSVFLGNNVKINSSLDSNPIGGDRKTILFIKNGGKIRIGNNVGISNTTIVSHKLIEIEDYVFIGGNCKIYDTDFHSIQFNQRVSIPDNDIKTAPVIIKKGAFIGAHSIILKGVTIGEKSVIGAGSVITKSIPDGEIWAGNPAKFIRKVDSE